MVDLPKRENNRPTKLIISGDYSYSEVLEKNIDFILINAIKISKNDLSLPMDKLVELLEKHRDIQLKFDDYESAVFIDKVFKNKINNKCFLMDDSLRISREYIDLSVLKNISLSVPLNYLMWGIKFNESVDTYCYLFQNTQANYLNPTSMNGNEKVSYEDYIKIIKKVDELAKRMPLDKKDRVAFISDYIQSNTQYIEAYESESSRGTFVTPDFPKYEEYRLKSGLVETILNEHNGVCCGIANASTMLLNNPLMDMEVESVYGNCHVWNKVLIDGKHYYFDNTWAITRNENMCEDGLVALSFSKKYLLFGQKTADDIKNHNAQSVFIYGGIISEDDIKDINYNQQFSYNQKPIYKSFKK